MTEPLVRLLGLGDQHRLLPFYPAIAAGIGALYGPDAESEYLAKAERLWAVNLAHPAVTVLGAFDSGVLAGLAVAFRRDEHADIAFLFVQDALQARGMEAALVRDLVRRLRAQGVRSIVSECIPLGALDLDGAYASLGFTVVPRLLMSAPLSESRLRMQSPDQTRALDSAEWGAAVHCLVEAYRVEPGRLLHREMAHAERALEFLGRIQGGTYGPFVEAYAREYRHNGDCAGVALGAEAAPGVGFVLQLAVLPSVRRRGIARHLLLGLAEQFRQRGRHTLALGVTQSNPALGLYTAVGFTPLREVTAYVWCNPLELPPSE